MATTSTSTVSPVQAAFVTAASSEVPSGVTVWRMWPGPRATVRMVFFTDVSWVDTEDALIKTGRRHRDEEYQANFEIWQLVTAEPDGGGDVVDDVFAIYDACEEAVVKDNSTVRAVDGVLNVVCQPVRLEPLEFETGWGVVLTAGLNVTARLS